MPSTLSKLTTRLLSALCLGVLLPTVASAVAPKLTDIIDAFTGSLTGFVAVAFGIAFVVFLWGVVTFIHKAGDDAEIAKGRQRMLWGVVGLFVIASVWGIVAILQALFGVDADKTECESPSVTVSGSAYQLKTCE
ncbi:MAG: hypothetical protein KBD24_03350 [Candidatus Pacebacteria bacterium]|nr:hypothetical protein [Candidatus Paceibacterota bacterium]